MRAGNGYSIDMGRESREVWVKRVERWRSSGLSAGEFAVEVGVNANTLQNWGGWRLSAKRRCSEGRTAPKTEAVQWIEVAAATKEQESAPLSPSAPPEKFELVLASGRTLRVPAGFEAEALRRLLTVVG